MVGPIVEMHLVAVQVVVHRSWARLYFFGRSIGAAMVEHMYRMVGIEQAFNGVANAILLVVAVYYS